MRSGLNTAFGIAAFVALFAAPAVQAAELTIAGSTTVASTVLVPYEGKIEKRSGMALRINPIGSSRGIMALAHGNADIAAISAPLSEVVRKINSKQPGSVDGRGLVAHEIGDTKVAFIVHPSNPVKELSFKQITDLLAGRIEFWSEIGGPNQRVEVVAEYQGGGIRTLVEEKIGEWGDVLTEVSSVQTGPQVVFAVAQVPNAIGIVSAAMVDSRVYMLRSDESIVQPMYLVTKGQPGTATARVIDAARHVAGGTAGGV